MSEAKYRRKVLAHIFRILGGKPKFALDEYAIQCSFLRGHDPIVPAEWMIENAIDKEKFNASNRMRSEF